MQRILLTSSRLQIHTRYIRLPSVGKHPREVRFLPFVCMPETGEITINCTRTLLEIQDKYTVEKKENERGGKDFRSRYCVPYIVPCCFASPKEHGVSQCFRLSHLFRHWLYRHFQNSARERERTLENIIQIICVLCEISQISDNFFDLKAIYDISQTIYKIK